MKRKKEIEISNRVINILKNKGFRINKYYAKTTRSIYIKLDYGVCGGIRISDHKGKKKYRYKFNLIKGYKGPKQILDRGYNRLYYNYENTDELITDIQKEKIDKIQKYGIINYKKFMIKNAKDDLYKSFEKVA